MSRTSNESEDGMLYHTESPLVDDGNGGSPGIGVVLKKGPWTSSEDAILVEYVKNHGEGNWNAVQKHSGLSRCGKSCRLRWANHLRPNLKKGAFTPHEESLILELHSQIGNKWARMASFLPGRTDNEIKNYWNTRVKRRQRAGLPLYPPDLCFQSFKENQQGQNSASMGGGDLGKHEPFQANAFEIPEVVFDGLKWNGDNLTSCASDIPDMGTAFMKSLASPHYHGFASQTFNRQKRLRESSNVYPVGIGCVQNKYPQQIEQFQNNPCLETTDSFGQSFQQNIDPNQSLLSFGPAQGVHSLQNGNFSASKPANGAVKSELPSLQYQDFDFSMWENFSPLPLLESTEVFIQSPPRTFAFESDYFAPQNSGLLDDLVHEAQNRKHSSEKSLNSSNFAPDDMVDGMLNMDEPDCYNLKASTSPMSPVPSILDECISPPSQGSLDNADPTLQSLTGNCVKVKTEPIDINPVLSNKDRECKTQAHSFRPDVLLDANWFASLGITMGDNEFSNFPGNDPNDAGSGNSSLSHQGYGGCGWKSMPSVVNQMSDHHCDPPSQM